PLSGERSAGHGQGDFVIVVLVGDREGDGVAIQFEVLDRDLAVFRRSNGRHLTVVVFERKIPFVLIAVRGLANKVPGTGQGGGVGRRGAAHRAQKGERHGKQ